MGWLAGVFAVAKAIPVLDKYLDASLESYRAWKYRRDKTQGEDAFKKAKEESDTEDLQREISEKL
jgi:hypothetical protein